MGNRYSEMKENSPEKPEQKLTERERLLSEKFKSCPFIKLNPSKQLVVCLPFNETGTSNKDCNIVIKTYDLTGLTDEEISNVVEEAFNFIETKLIPRIKELFHFDEDERAGQK